MGKRDAIAIVSGGAQRRTRSVVESGRLGDDIDGRRDSREEKGEAERETLLPFFPFFKKENHNKSIDGDTGMAPRNREDSGLSYIYCKDRGGGGHGHRHCEHDP